MTIIMTLTPGQITLQDLTEIYWQDKLVRLNPTTRTRINAAAVCISDAAEGTETIYGVNTGFGKLANTRIALKDTIRLQRNLILSHSCGVGPPLPERIVRLVMALKLLSLGQGLLDGIEDLDDPRVIQPQTDGGLPIESLSKLLALGILVAAKRGRSNKA